MRATWSTHGFSLGVIHFVHSSCRVLSVGQASDSCQYQRVSLQHGTAIQQARTVSNYPSNCCRLQYIEQISLPVCRCHCYTAALCCWFSPLGQTDTRSGYVMLCIIENFVCAVSDVCSSNTSGFIFVCLLSVKAALSSTYGQLLH